MKAATSSDNLRGLLRGSKVSLTDIQKIPFNDMGGGGVGVADYVKSNWNKLDLSFLVVLAWSSLVLSTLIG